MKAISRRGFLVTSAATGVMLAAGRTLSGATPQKETSPVGKPRSTAGSALFNLLQKRHSSREFSPDPLPVGTLLQLLWAAFGINRPDGKRTAPSARNRQETDIYVAAPDGLYLYDAKGNSLKRILTEDIRGLTGVQPFVKQAAVNLVYVADTSKMDDMPQEQRCLWMGTGTGAIVQNVYLFCTAEGLATVVRAMIDRPALAKAMKLRPDQAITLSQSVGYPREAG